MANQEKPQNTNREQKFNPRQDVKQPGREPLPVEKNPTQSTGRNSSRSQRDDHTK